jgi:hypothetical protein
MPLVRVRQPLALQARWGGGVMSGYDDVFVLMTSTMTARSWEDAQARLAKLRGSTVGEVADWLELAGEPAAAGLLRKWGVPDPGLNVDGVDWAAAFVPHGDTWHRLLLSESRGEAEERVELLRERGFRAWLMTRTWDDDRPSDWTEAAR